METPNTRERRSDGIGLSVLSESEFLYKRIALERGLSFTVCRSWDAEPRSFGLPVDVTVLHEWDVNRASRCVVFEIHGVLVRLNALSDGSIRIEAATRHVNRGELDEVIEELLRLMPEVKADDRVPIRFWLLDGNREITSTMRSLHCPSWESIACNYSRSTKSRLHRLMALDELPSGGKLLLWHGPPGTGKTWAIQALARSWSSWCRVEYVTDPEAFLGSSHYLMQTLLQIPSAGARRRTGSSLFVLEDTGELLSADAKERVGQALSRFLNLVDGFIGRGLDLMVLVTANEEVRTLHPAVSRPGRCAATIEFTPLSPDEAARSLAAKDGSHGPEGPRTLAELYAGERLEDTPKARPAIGFRVGAGNGRGPK